MGLSSSLYAGPVARCTSEIVSGCQRRCINPHCPKGDRARPMEEEFCDACDQPLETISQPTATTKSAVGPRDVCEALSKAGLDPEAIVEIHQHFDDPGGPPTTHWYIPNHSRDRPRNFNPRGDSFLFLSEVRLADEVWWFLRFFQPELDVLRQLYPTLVVDWAVITYKS